MSLSKKKSLQQRLAVEVLEAANLPPSVDGGAPDSFIELTVVPYGRPVPKSLDVGPDPVASSSSPSAAPIVAADVTAAGGNNAVVGTPAHLAPAGVRQTTARPHSRNTAMIRASTSPKWNERFVLDVDGEPDAIAPTYWLTFRLLERPADVKKSLVLVGGQHALEVGGHRRQRGCAWLALSEPGELAVVESPSKFYPSVPCLRVAWEVLEDYDPTNALLNQAGDVSHSSVLRRPVVREGPVAPDPTSEAAAAGGGGGAGAASAGGDGSAVSVAVLQRLRTLEERLDHLDSIFRVRQDYEAEVQRMMAATSVPTPSLAPAARSGAALSVVDDVRTVQPSYFSVGSLSSPSMQPGCRPSDANHFPLRLSATKSSVGGSSGSALQGILLEPTIVSNHDKEIASRYAFKPVPLPEPRKIGFIPTPPLAVPPLMPGGAR
jgi:hypothetical protein